VTRPLQPFVRRAGWAISVLCALGLTARASAEDAPEPRVVSPAETEAQAEYDRAIDMGIVEHNAGRFAEARTQYMRAHELAPSARTLRALGMVEFELRNYGESVNYLERALASEEKALDASLRRQTEDLLSRARAYVGEVHVAVDPDTAMVMVDGVTVASGPEASFTLVVGDHELEFRAHGRLPEKRAIRIRGGDQTRLRVVLTHPGEDDTGAAPAAALRSEREPFVRKWWLWTAVGAVAAGAAVGIALAVRRDERREGDPVHTDNSVGMVVSTLGRR
jgi:tetratricopeptide (TPR) repeat protein